MILKEEGYSYNDLTIVPACLSPIQHRHECSIVDENGMLPLFAAPMSCIIDEHNYKIWKHYGINTIMPRTVPYKTRLDLLCNDEWVAFSLAEFEKLFCSGEDMFKGKASSMKVCVDLANGHMEHLYDTISKAKDLAALHGNKLVVMTGNIANPDTFSWLWEYSIPVDYIRLSIGSGHGCLTSSNTGVHYPIGSLIDECKKIKTRWHSNIKIVADGGIRNYKDINIALALGADYVMVGSLFAGIAESSSNMYVNNGEKEIEVLPYILDMLDALGDENRMIKETQNMKNIINSLHAKKKFYGMSTPEAQMEINKALETPVAFSKKTSEGLSKMVDCKYTLKQWVENFSDYLRSAMSYTGSYTLEHFRNNTSLIINSTQTVGSVNK